MPERDDEAPAKKKRASKVTSITGAIERKKWERARDRALSKHMRVLEALVESADFSRGLETTDFDALLAQVEDAGDEVPPETRAQLRCARALRSCTRGDEKAGFAEWAEVIADSPELALPYVIRARWKMRTDPKAAIEDLDRTAGAMITENRRD